MKRNILIIVARDEDRPGVFELIGNLVPDKGPRDTARKRGWAATLDNGDKYTVFSLEEWFPAITRGVAYDAVCPLVQMPQFVLDTLNECSAGSAKAVACPG